MKKLYVYLPFILLLTVFSCKKDSLSSLNTTDDLSSRNLGTHHKKAGSGSGGAALKDTVPPAGAVSVKTYGAYGDGSHDDTQAIQNAINAKTILYFPSGTYIINSTLNMRSGVSVYGTNGATIKAGASMSGSLLANGRAFYLYNVSNAAIINLKFLPSTKAYNVAAWSNAVIYVSSSSTNTIEYNTFTFNQAYNPNGIDAVWISGASSTYNYVGYNTMTSMGIEYAESGASYNTVTYNTITNSFSDALSAHGNSSTFCTNNRVLYNKVTNAGHMGIEDWGSITGTLVRGNVINGTGKSAAEASTGIGISMVGVNSTCSSNTISNAQTMYIEVGGNNNLKIDSNTINDTQLAITGIIVNCVTAAPAGSTSYSASIVGNHINGCNEAISVQGDQTPNATVSNNTATDAKWMAFVLSTNATKYNVTFSNNKVVFDKPNTEIRIAYSSYSGIMNSAQKATYSGNTATYATTATGGVGEDVAFSIGTCYTTYTSNTVTGNNITSKYGTKVFAITSNGYKMTGITYNYNTMTGSTVDLTNLTMLSNLGNVL